MDKEWLYVQELRGLVSVHAVVSIQTMSHIVFGQGLAICPRIAWLGICGKHLDNEPHSIWTSNGCMFKMCLQEVCDMVHCTNKNLGHVDVELIKVNLIPNI